MDPVPDVEEKVAEQMDADDTKNDGPKDIHRLLFQSEEQEVGRIEVCASQYNEYRNAENQENRFHLHADHIVGKHDAEEQDDGNEKQKCRKNRIIRVDHTQRDFIASEIAHQYI